MAGNRLLRRIFGFKNDDANGECSNLKINFFLLCNRLSPWSGTKPQAYGSNVLFGRVFRTSQGAIIDECGVMVES